MDAKETNASPRKGGALVWLLGFVGVVVVVVLVVMKPWQSSGSSPATPQTPSARIPPPQQSTATSSSLPTQPPPPPSQKPADLEEACALYQTLPPGWRVGPTSDVFCASWPIPQKHPTFCEFTPESIAESEEILARDCPPDDQPCEEFKQSFATLLQAGRVFVNYAGECEPQEDQEGFGEDREGFGEDYNESEFDQGQQPIDLDAEQVDSEEATIPMPGTFPVRLGPDPTSPGVFLSDEPEELDSGGEMDSEGEVDSDDDQGPIGPLPVDCVMEFGEWSQCSVSCGGGQRTRRTEQKQAAAHGGKECPAVVVESEACNTQPCPVDCVMEFGEWSQCSAPCDGGVQTRRTEQKVAPAHGGKTCDPVITETRTCNTAPCDRDCIVKWSDWGDCVPSCISFPGQESWRQRKLEEIVQAQRGNGAPCPSLTVQSQKCEPPNTSSVPPCPVHCVQTGWSGWSTCPTCIPAGQPVPKTRRTRLTLLESAHGGTACGPLEEEKDCERVPICPTPVDCEMDPGQWSACSVSCGGGTQSRTSFARILPQHGGQACPDPRTETQACNSQPCPVNCEMEWGPWTACSATCGGGTRTQSTRIKVEPMHGGTQCPALQTNTEACNTQPCPINCAMTGWTCLAVTDKAQFQTPARTRTCWPDASGSCTTGVRVCVRRITTAAQHGGLDCPDQDSTTATNSARNQLATWWSGSLPGQLNSLSLEALITLALQERGLNAVIPTSTTVVQTNPVPVHEQIREVVTRFGLKQVRVENCTPSIAEMRTDCATHRDCAHVTRDIDLASPTNWKRGVRLPGMCGTAAAPADCTNENYFLCGKCATTGTYQPTAAYQRYARDYATISDPKTVFSLKQEFVTALRNGRTTAAAGPCTSLNVPTCQSCRTSDQVESDVPFFDTAMANAKPQYNYNMKCNVWSKPRSKPGSWQKRAWCIGSTVMPTTQTS
jgi:hypothetical protein